MFQLYMLLNADMPYVHPYVAVGNATDVILQVHEEHVNIASAADSTFFESDYMATSRYVAFDLPLLDKLMKAYTGMDEYRLIVRFNQEKHITITYHSPNNESAKDYDIFLGYPSKRAEQLIAALYPLMEQLKKDVLDIED